MNTAPKCRKCGGSISEQDGFCPFCGHAVDEIQPTTKQKKCASCGALNDADMAFCTACGKKLSDTLAAATPENKVQSTPLPPVLASAANVRCVSCGFVNASSDVFCDGCGAKLTPNTDDVSALQPVRNPHQVDQPQEERKSSSMPDETVADALNKEATPSAFPAAQAGKVNVKCVCGFINAADATFCNECGAKLTSGTAQNTPLQPVQESIHADVPPTLNHLKHKTPLEHSGLSAKEEKKQPAKIDIPAIKHNSKIDAPKPAEQRVAPSDHQHQTVDIHTREHIRQKEEANTRDAVKESVRSASAKKVLVWVGAIALVLVACVGFWWSTQSTEPVVSRSTATPIITATSAPTQKTTATPRVTTSAPTQKTTATPKATTTSTQTPIVTACPHQTRRANVISETRFLLPGNGQVHSLEIRYEYLCVTCNNVLYEDMETEREAHHFSDDWCTMCGYTKPVAAQIVPYNYSTQYSMGSNSYFGNFSNKTPYLYDLMDDNIHTSFMWVSHQSEYQDSYPDFTFYFDDREITHIKIRNGDLSSQNNYYGHGRLSELILNIHYDGKVAMEYVTVPDTYSTEYYEHTMSRKYEDVTRIEVTYRQSGRVQGSKSGELNYFYITDIMFMGY